MGREFSLCDSSSFTFLHFSKIKTFPNQWLHQQTAENSYEGIWKERNNFCVFRVFLHPPIFQTLTRKSPSFNNACHKNMYKCFFFASLCRRIYFPLCIWVKRTWNQRPFFRSEGGFFLFSSPLIETESRGGYFWSWNFCVFREQYTPRLRIFLKASCSAIFMFLESEFFSTKKPMKR